MRCRGLDVFETAGSLLIGLDPDLLESVALSLGSARGLDWLISAEGQAAIAG